MNLDIVPTLWEIIYPVHPNDPIGYVRRLRDGFHAQLRDEDLGVHPDPDTAVVAVWDRFIEQTASQHAMVAVTHGGYERHPGER